MCFPLSGCLGVYMPDVNNHLEITGACSHSRGFYQPSVVLPLKSVVMHFCHSPLSCHLPTYLLHHPWISLADLPLGSLVWRPYQLHVLSVIRKHSSSLAEESGACSPGKMTAANYWEACHLSFPPASSFYKLRLKSWSHFLSVSQSGRCSCWSCFQLWST